MNYVYLTNPQGDGFNLYTVGFYAPNGKWEPESDHATSESAAARVHYLNGGGSALAACKAWERARNDGGVSHADLYEAAWRKTQEAIAQAGSGVKA